MAYLRGGAIAGGAESPLPVGSRLPSLISRSATGEVRWRDPSRGSTVAVFLQAHDREGDKRYLDDLIAAAPDFAIWDGRVIVVAPGGFPGTPSSDGAGQGAALVLVADPTGEAEHCGVREGEDAVLIADRWGQIFHGARGASPAALPTPAEISEWLKYLATQCPECGVPDQP